MIMRTLRLFSRFVNTSDESSRNTSATISLLLSFALMAVLSSSAFASVTVNWGWGFASFDGPYYTKVGDVQCIAPQQAEVALVAVTSSSPPSTPLVVSGSSFVQVALWQQLGTTYYYNVTIPSSEQNPAASRAGYFSVTDGVGGPTQQYSFIQAAATIGVVEAASFSNGKRRRGALSSLFGPPTGVAATSASAPLPTILAGNQVWVTYFISSNQLESIACRLSFTSSTQTNFLQEFGDAGTVQNDVGYWLITQNNDLFYQKATLSSQSGTLNTSPIASVFSKSADGHGVPAMDVQVCDAGTGNCVYEQVNPCSYSGPCGSGSLQVGNAWYYPIEVNRSGKDVYFNIYATGMRKANSGSSQYPTNSQVQGVLDSVTLTTTFIGQQPSYLGLDQLQFKVPASLGGTPRVASFRIKSQYDPNASNPWYFGSVEWQNQIPDNITSGTVKNILSIPIK